MQPKYLFTYSLIQITKIKEKKINIENLINLKCLFIDNAQHHWNIKRESLYYFIFYVGTILMFIVMVCKMYLLHCFIIWCMYIVYCRYNLPTSSLLKWILFTFVYLSIIYIQCLDQKKIEFIRKQVRYTCCCF